MKKTAFLIYLFIVLNSVSVAQEAFTVGDEVEVYCTCLGPMRWTVGRVEQISGNTIKVRYGNLKNQFTTVPNTPEMIVRRGQTQTKADENSLRNQFRIEAGKYLQIVQFYAPFYDTAYKKIGLPPPHDLQKSINLLVELDVLCKAKYSKIKDYERPWNKDTISFDNPSVWCLIAAKNKDLEKPFRTESAKTYLQSLLTITLTNLNKAIKDKDNRTADEIQKLLFEPAQWKAEMNAKAKQKFAEYGVEMPSDFFAEVEKKADELLSLINKNAPNRNWQKPPYNDAAVESFIRTKYSADVDYKGVKVFKTGLDYTTWKKYESLSYLGSDSNFRYYKVEYNEYKRGWVLVKLPNQPFCQAQEFIVGRQSGKIVLVSLGGSGIFMKCD